jgi:hypothetical protein
VSNAYNAWKAAHLALDGELGEDLKGALELAADALREPAKRQRVSDLLRSYAAHVRGDIDEHDDGYREEDFAGLVADTLSEFEQAAPAAPASAPDGLPTKALDAFKAMESLNYTGEHTHFEVLADARQVLAAVMLGKAIPRLERFRCPSIAHLAGIGQTRCSLQLPHDGDHRAQTHTTDTGGVGVWKSWTDEESDNPPKSYDPPSDTCGSTRTLSGSSRVAVCARKDKHKGVHCDAAGREWI